MDFSVCTQCGTEIENKGIHFRGRTFCCDECCEEFEEEFAKKGEPVLAELVDPDFEEDDLGYRNDDDEEELLDVDDDFDIKLDDF